MINNTTIDLFRHTHVKATVAGLHMECRNLATFGWNDGHTAIGITQHQKCFWLYLCQHAIDSNDDIADGFCTRCTRSIEKMVRFTNPQILEEDFIEFIIVVLAGMDQNMFAMSIQRRHDARQTDDFRTGTNDSNNFHFLHKALSLNHLTY
ncbi:hypothetical protein D9M72_579870 [compost metagenome]